MTVKIPLKEITQNIQLLSELTTNTMPARTAYKFTKIIKQCVDEVNQYNVARKALIEKYAQRNEKNEIIYDNNQATVSSDNYTLFQQELNDLLNTEVEINVLPIKLNELDNLDFTPGQLIMLYPFIEED